MGTIVSYAVFKLFGMKCLVAIASVCFVLVSISNKIEGSHS